MYSRILVPVDLAHAEKLSKALDTAVAMAKSHGAEIVYAGVTSTTPSEVAHSPSEYAAKLEEFARVATGGHDVKAEAMPIEAHDPAIELGEKLVDAVRKSGSDLVVMASHVPGLADHIFQGNAAHVAAHAPCSVFVVR